MKNYNVKKLGVFLMCFLVLSSVLLISLASSGCRKSVKTDVITDTATIDKVEYVNEKRTPKPTTKLDRTVSYNVTPEKYNVTVMYQGVRYTLDNKNDYNWCLNKNGDKVQCRFNVTTYDNGEKSTSLSEILEGTK